MSTLSEVIRKITGIKFSKSEPASTSVVWAYPNNTTYEFRVYNNGHWVPLDMSEGTGDIDIDGLIRTLTEMLEGKVNVDDLSPVATSGSYNDLLDRPSETDPTVPAWAKQSSKPTYTAEEVGALPSSTVIPIVPTNVSAFTNDAGYLTRHQDISHKEDKMGIVTTDAATLDAEVGKYYRFTADVGTLDVTLPTMTDTSHISSVVLYMTTGTSPSITFTSTHSVLYQEGFSLDASKTYEINCLFNGAAWVLMAAEINTGS